MASPTATATITTTTTTTTEVPTFLSFLWANPRFDASQPTVHPVPKNFSFPTKKVSDMFVLWEYGNLGEKIGPYKFIRPWDLDTKAKNTMRSRIQAVMNYFIESARQRYPSFDSMEKSLKLSTFRAAYLETIGKLYAGVSSSRSMVDGTLTFSIMYQRLLELKKKEAVVVEDSSESETPSD
jgi:hypothetical protein